MFIIEASSVVSEKLTSGTFSSEEGRVVSLEAERAKREAEISKGIKAIIPDETDRQRAGMLLSDVPTDALLPPGYIISPEGVFRKDEEWVRLTRTPFFIAGKTYTQIHLYYLFNNEWLRAVLKPSEVKPSTLSNLFIFPEPGIKAKSLLAYAQASIVYAPASKSEDFIASFAKEMFLQYTNTETAFPTLVSVSSVIEFCGTLDIKYEELRKYLEIHGYIDPGPGKVKRAPDKVGFSRPQRFLVLLKPFKDGEGLEAE